MDKMEINSFFSTDWKLIVGFLESGLSIKDKEENGKVEKVTK